MDDLISRQAAIKLAIDLDFESRGVLKESKCREIVNRYNMILSVQPEPDSEWRKKYYGEAYAQGFVDGCKLYERQLERKKGKWIEVGDWSEGVGMGESYGNYYKCSICEKRVRNEYKHCDMNFCPYCGADMREESEDAEVH